MLYEKYQNRFRICALCDNRILSIHVVCAEHKQEYEQYKDELWFQELVSAQDRQYQIDTAEFRYIHKMDYIPKQNNTKPRSKLTQNNKNQIALLRKEGLGWRKIAKRLNLNPHTVRSHIYKK